MIGGLTHCDQGFNPITTSGDGDQTMSLNDQQGNEQLPVPPADSVNDPGVSELLREMSDKYAVHSILGRGAGSIVYKAMDLVSGQTVALKIIPKHRLSKKLAQSQSVIQREILMMASLYHPNIVRLLNHHNAENYIVIVTEYVSGGELFHELVKQGSFSEELTRQIIIQIAEGVKYLHLERGIIHRDLKLENLLFEKDISISESNCSGIGIVKIADFGLAKVVHDTNTQTPCGTFEYSAPEIFRHQHYSKSVDMWALGCVLYTMLCGFPPFYGDSPGVIASKVRQGQFAFQSPWWDAISIEAKDLVCRLLDTDPKQRLDINTFFFHPWIKGEKLPPAVPLIISPSHQAMNTTRYMSNKSKTRNMRPSLNLHLNRTTNQTPFGSLTSPSLKSPHAPNDVHSSPVGVKDFLPALQRITVQTRKVGWGNTKFLSKPLETQADSSWPDLSEQTLVSPVDSIASPLSSTSTSFGSFLPSPFQSSSGESSTPTTIVPSLSSPSSSVPSPRSFSSHFSLRTPRPPNVPPTINEGEALLELHNNMSSTITLDSASVHHLPPPPPTNTPTSATFTGDQLLNAAMTLASLERVAAVGGLTTPDSPSTSPFFSMPTTRPVPLTKDVMNAATEAYHDVFTMDDMVEDGEYNQQRRYVPQGIPLGSVQGMEGIEDGKECVDSPSYISAQIRNQVYGTHMPASQPHQSLNIDSSSDPERRNILVPRLKSTDETQSSLLIRRRNRLKSGINSLGVNSNSQEITRQ